MYNNKGAYANPNPQSNVPASTVQDSIALINQEYPKPAGKAVVRKSLTRTFPDDRTRDIIVFRYETSKVKYVVLTDETGKQWVQERKVVAENMPALT